MHNHEHGSGHDHNQSHSCGCGCGCGHEHHHEHEHEHCGCAHEHHHEAEHSHCSCGHEHHDHDHCGCDHDHHHDDGCGCGCGHDHSHEDPSESKRELWILAVAAALLIIGFLFRGAVGTALHIAAFLLVAWDILRQAWDNLRRGYIFGESFLMTIAGIGAVCIGEIPEGVMVFLLYRLGEYLQTRAVSSSRRSISNLLDVRPDMANLISDGKVTEVNARDVAVGATILVRPGEKIPLDGTVRSGVSQLDTAALTGESIPRDVAAGEKVLAGSINLVGALEILVEKPFGESTASKILEMVEHASRKKAVSEKFITRFARKYTPAVVAAASVVAVVPPLLGLMEWRASLYSALCFLAISCPCSLVISVPLSFFAGIGRASREGILVKGGNHIETMAAAQIVAFDKTGTLTSGSFTVTDILTQPGADREEVLQFAAAVESGSNHPIARSICRACEKDVSSLSVQQLREHAGSGVSAMVADRAIVVGRPGILQEHGIPVTEVAETGFTAVYVAADGHHIGTVLLQDLPKNDAADAITRLKALGIRHCGMLSGDNAPAVEAVARRLGLDRAVGELLPGEKLAELDKLRSELSGKGKLLYVGDGINDTPVLAAADLGIAMGGLGADAAIETADAIIMSDEPGKVADGIEIARRTVGIAKENIIFSIVIKLAVMLLSVMGHVELWAAVLADVGICLLCVLNTLRINRFRPGK